MERILLATIYPHVHTLGLYDLTPETASGLFSNGSRFLNYFANQIASFVIEMNCVEQTDLIEKQIMIIFTQICTTFKHLQCLYFNSSSGDQPSTFDRTQSIAFSSNVLELHVVVNSMSDCLHLLNGHFNQLHTFDVTVTFVSSSALPDNKKKLSNLKCFSLIHEDELCMYNEILVPLLERMSNLEELSLYFIIRYGSIIDGDNLNKNIINRMTKLNKFTFNICSAIRINNQVNLPSNEDIQNTFRNFPNSNQIISYVNCFSKSNSFHCHIYSYPYPWNFYYNITNSFPSGLFKSVRQISLYDERPFEYEFFLRITQSFPFMEKLSLYNCEPQENDNQQYLIIKYPHLTKLDFIKTHENYVEQFLNDTKTRLSHNVYLHVSFNLLKKVTDNFTKDATRINCSKLIGLVLDCKPEVGKLKDYFPHAEIY